ncbi:serine/threonine-protein kinase [Slackia heliotrinireducens]|uniref:serine/threonine-protein kinase n=1 Tax=Slackia heliotrinireducens TaxID=84110 RepID=UPI003315AC13
MQNLILNRYRPLGTAGKGGYATVQVAWDTRIQRRVAIKCLRLDNMPIGLDVPESEIPGLTEARTAAMLSDRSIVGVLDFEIEGDMAYLIMEYVDGVTLTELMQREGMLSADVCACVFGAVAHALDFAHDNLVLHMDIKPDNVLINRQGEVKVSDFGLAQLSHEAGYGRAVGGTIGYMPLEQMRLEALDERTDEWALAAMTYQMLTGDNPFYANDLAAAESAIENAEIVIPSQVRNDFSEEADDVLFKALAIEREGRYDSVEEFAAELQPHLGDARRGRRELAVIVGDAREDSGIGDTAEMPPSDITYVDRIGSRGWEFLGRLAAAVECGFIGALSLMGIDQLQSLGANATAVFWGVLAAMVVLGGALPTIGSLAAVIVMATALVLAGNPVLGLVVGITGAAWWFLSGRFGMKETFCGLAAPLLGGMWIASAAPLLGGYLLRWRDALASAAFGGVVSFALACTGSSTLAGWGMLAHSFITSGMDDSVLDVLLRPEIWLLFVAWLVAAVVVSGACSRGVRWLACAGMFAGASLIMAAVLCAQFLTSDGATVVPALVVFIPNIVVLSGMVVLTLFGVPQRD